ncbi:hypothetical protein MTR67_006840 [Solanum verrucosum]|uniref:Reverse transcriptase domain-containing protein n=1 Tax=Solanum verrucosum TaxID=315347 RepID=A0AAF0Q261_SOLVR|nr:hypothetical protein MTR67_006840 [Solanum verrucosum]
MKYKGMLLFAMSIDKGLKKSDETILAALVELKPDVTVEVLDCMAEMLKQCADLMLPKLQKMLYQGGILIIKLICFQVRALNKAIVNNNYPIPLVQDLMDRLSKACWFTKLDLRAGYWQVRIVEGDDPMTTCVTRYGSYEFLVMPVGLTKASATFYNFMNNVLFDYLDDFVVVYLDDIVIYCRTLDEYVNHFSMVLSHLMEYTFYVKMEKCEFSQKKIKFLGHFVSKNKVRMEPKKVHAIIDWQAPRNVKDLRLFLGLANYYRKFIVG